VPGTPSTAGVPMVPGTPSPPGLPSIPGTSSPGQSWGTQGITPSPAPSLPGSLPPSQVTGPHPTTPVVYPSYPHQPFPMSDLSQQYLPTLRKPLPYRQGHVPHLKVGPRQIILLAIIIIAIALGGILAVFALPATPSLTGSTSVTSG